jgi:hypothetical protein
MPVEAETQSVQSALPLGIRVVEFSRLSGLPATIRRDLTTEFGRPILCICRRWKP